MPRAGVIGLLRTPLMPHHIIHAVIPSGRDERELPCEHIGALIEFDPEPDICDLLEVHSLLEPQRCSRDRVLAAEVARRLGLGVDIARKISRAFSMSRARWPIKMLTSL